jgi:hypothetical protein
LRFVCKRARRALARHGNSARLWPASQHRSRHGEAVGSLSCSSKLPIPRRWHRRGQNHSAPIGRAVESSTCVREIQPTVLPRADCDALLGGGRRSNRAEGDHTRSSGVLAIVPGGKADHTVAMVCDKVADLARIGRVGTRWRRPTSTAIRAPRASSSTMAGLWSLNDRVIDRAASTPHLTSSLSPDRDSMGWGM